jgi:hypothetical protein
MEDVTKTLKELAEAYEDANENDFVQSGQYQGSSPANIVNLILRAIKRL